MNRYEFKTLENLTAEIDSCIKQAWVYFDIGMRIDRSLEMMEQAETLCMVLSGKIQATIEILEERE